MKWTKCVSPHHSSFIIHNFPTIWIDLENTPHVPFFIPIIRDLEQRGFEVILTARDFAQTKELAQNAGLRVQIIGGEYGNSTIRKSIGILLRAICLAWYMKGRNISLAVGHGSRGLLLASRLLRVPSLTLYDYEGASVSLFNRLSTWVMTPEIIHFATLERLGLKKQKHLTYPGLKEEVYVSDFKPDASIVSELGLDAAKIVVTVRPPSSTAHYRADASFKLFDDILSILADHENVQVILMPRNAAQRADLEIRILPFILHPSSFILPARAVDGLNLLYHSDLVIGGGGTMNREAAAMGVPVVSIFKGPEGAVDRWLIEQGKMIAIEKAEEIVPLLHKRDRSLPRASIKTREAILAAIRKLL
jgi:predicted glycosyltransferase